jgi:hypothetical protein
MLNDTRKFVNSICVPIFLLLLGIFCVQLYGSSVIGVGAGACGGLAGVGIGYLLETKYIRMEPPAKNLHKVLRIAIGLSIIILLIAGFELLRRAIASSMFISVTVYDFTYVFILGFVVTFIIPLLFVKYT